MLKLTKTGMGLLTKQYRSVLRKCLLINLFLSSCIASNNIYANIILGSPESYSFIVNNDGTLTGMWGATDANGVYISGPYLTGTIHYLNLVRWGLGLRGNTNGYNTLTGLDSFRSEGFTFAAVIDLDSKLYDVENQLLNYYYTFRDDKTSEVIEFAEENDSLSLMEVCHA